MKGPTIKVKLTSDSYKKWIKWQKNLGELLMRAEQERKTGFLLIINVKKNYGYATLLGCDGALLAAKGISPAMLETAGRIEKEVGDLYFRHCAESPTLVLEHEHGASEDSILMTTGKKEKECENRHTIMITTSAGGYASLQDGSSGNSPAADGDAANSAGLC